MLPELALPAGYGLAAMTPTSVDDPVVVQSIHGAHGHQGFAIGHKYRLN
jgi:hypothetical protein